MQLKSFTDLEQSKKLTEILPLESADMCYLPTHIGDEHHFIASLSPYSVCTKMTDVSIEYCTPCWSLAALLSVLPDYTLQDNPDGTVFVVSEKKKPIMSDDYDNPVDACYEMIIRLNDLKLL